MGSVVRLRGVTVASTSGQILIECHETVGVAVAFSRLVDGMSVMLERERNSSTHQFECNSEDMEIHRLDFGVTQMD